MMGKVNPTQRPQSPTVKAESAIAVAKGGVNSVEVAGDLLRALSETAGPARLTDLARMTSIPPAKVHRYLMSLIRAGLVEQDRATSRYDFGPLALRAGIVALSRSDALKRAERVLEDIVEQTGETAAVIVWGTHGPTIVRRVHGRREFASSVPLGHACALTFSAAGLIYCAFGEPHRVEPLIAKELAQSRATGRLGVPSTKAELKAVVATVKANGVAQVAVEEDGGFAAVSAPVFSSLHRLQFALSVFGRVGQLNISPDSPVVSLMKEAARSLTAEIHGT
jgi:DNA-binding IclR family transcriptional regulator